METMAVPLTRKPLLAFFSTHPIEAFPKTTRVVTVATVGSHLNTQLFYKPIWCNIIDAVPLALLQRSPSPKIFLIFFHSLTNSCLLQPDDMLFLCRVQVPTLSLVLGLPIPYGNLGMVVPEVFHSIGDMGLGVDVMSSSVPSGKHRVPLRKRNRDKTEAEDEVHRFEPTFRSLWDLSRSCDTTTQALLLNAWQIQKYLTKYASEIEGGGGVGGGSLAVEQIHRVEALLFDAIQPVASVSGGEAGFDQTSCGVLSASFKSYVQAAAGLCRQLWTQFDLGLMSRAVVVMVCGCIMNIAIGFSNGTVFACGMERGGGNREGESTSASTFSIGDYVQESIGDYIQEWAPFALAMFVLVVYWAVDQTTFSGVAASAVAFVLLKNLVIITPAFGQEVVSQHVSARSASRKPNLLYCVVGFMWLVHLLALLSNSYIIAEQYVYLFMNSTVAFGLFLRGAQDSSHLSCLSALAMGLCGRVLHHDGSLDPQTHINAANLLVLHVLESLGLSSDVKFALSAIFPAVVGGGIFVYFMGERNHTLERSQRADAILKRVVQISLGMATLALLLHWKLYFECTCTEPLSCIEEETSECVKKVNDNCVGDSRTCGEHNMEGLQVEKDRFVPRSCR
jgi:hypothetical protein